MSFFIQIFGPFVQSVIDVSVCNALVIFLTIFLNYQLFFSNILFLVLDDFIKPWVFLNFIKENVY